MMVNISIFCCFCSKHHFGIRLSEKPENTYLINLNTSILEVFNKSKTATGGINEVKLVSGVVDINLYQLLLVLLLLKE